MDVEILGCVARPGHYQIAQGTSLREAVRKARPRSYADLSSIPPDHVVEEACVVKVLSREHIQVRVTGCVCNPGLFQMPAGSRVCDLRDRLVLGTRGVQEIFKSKRLLKDQEVFVVVESDRS